VAVIDEEEEKERARREVEGKRRWRSGQWVESWSIYAATATNSRRSRRGLVEGGSDRGAATTDY